MYNLHLAEHYNRLKKGGEALEYARRELGNRKTPAVYAQMAWAFAHQGRHDSAAWYADSFVLNKTFEPLPNYALAHTYSLLGDSAKAKPLRQAAREAAFELGPARIAALK